MARFLHFSMALYIYFYSIAPNLPLTQQKTLMFLKLQLLLMFGLKIYLMKEKILKQMNQKLNMMIWKTKTKRWQSKKSKNKLLHQVQQLRQVQNLLLQVPLLHQPPKVSLPTTGSETGDMIMYGGALAVLVSLGTGVVYYMKKKN